MVARKDSLAWTEERSFWRTSSCTERPPYALSDMVRWGVEGRGVEVGLG